MVVLSLTELAGEPGADRAQQRSRRGERLGGRPALVLQDVHGVEARVPEPGRGERAAAGDGHDRDASGPRGAGDGRGRLAVQRLLVQGSLPRDHEIGVRDGGAEAHRVEYEPGAWARPGPEERDRREAGSAGRARARVAAVVRAGGRRDDVGPVAEGRVEPADLLRVRALLRPVHRGGAGRPGERIVHVARDLERGPAKPWVQPAQVEAGGRRRAERVAGDRTAPGVEDAGAQRLRHAEAVVGGRTAADAEHDPGAAGVERGGDHLAHTPACGRQRGRPPGEPRKAGDGCQLDDGLGAAPRVRDSAGNAAGAGGAFRAGGFDRDWREARRRERGQQAVAPVGHRHGHDVGGRGRGADAVRQVPGRLGRRQRSLELVRSEQHPGHQPPSPPASADGRACTAVGASAADAASSSNSFTASMSLPMDTLVIRSRITSTITGTR